VATNHNLVVPLKSNAAEVRSELEAAALTARNLLHVASRELLEDLEQGLSLVAAAERYVSDVIALNEQLSTIGANGVADPRN